MKTVEQRLFDHSKVDPSTGCRLWQRYCDRDGYGQTYYKGSPRHAHRVAYQVFVGPIPDGLCILHSCHTPACINPEHLRVGTHKDNADDRDRAGRHGTAKLTWENVRTIRQKYSTGEYTQAEIAAPFGVSRHLISYIINGKYWKEQVSQ